MICKFMPPTAWFPIEDDRVFPNELDIRETGVIMIGGKSDYRSTKTHQSRQSFGLFNCFLVIACLGLSSFQIFAVVPGQWEKLEE